MAQVLATASIHDGGAIFTLAWSLVVIPASLAAIFNFGGMAKKMYWRGGRPMSPQTVQVFGFIFLASGLLFFATAISSFAQGGY